MKKTLTINLGGTVYHIDEDAYHLLDNLFKLTCVFTSVVRRERKKLYMIIKLRISELFTDRLNEGKQVITIEDVEEIIARMGKPEDLSDEESGEASVRKTKGTTMRRLFRDPDNKVLGGVASGLAAYMDGMLLGTYHSIGSWFLCSWGDIGLYHSVDYYSYGAYRSRETRHEGGCY